MYGNNFKKIMFRNTNKKYLFSKPFFKVLNNIEFKLKIFLLRINLSKNLLESKNMINNGLVKINGKSVNAQYIVKVNDCIQLLKINHSSKKIRTKKFR